MSDVTIDVSAFAPAWARLQGEVAYAHIVAMRDAVKIAERNARETTLWRDQRPNGGTRSTIQGNEFAGEGEIRAGGAAVFLEAGTRAHTIEPRNGKVLRFMVAGSYVFARKVNHPGTAARPFMKNASAAGGQALQRGLEEYTDRAAASFNG